MGSVRTKRVRDVNGAIAQLDLTAAAAASRRLDVKMNQHADAAGTRFVAFQWTKSTAQATAIQIYLVDHLNSDKPYLLEERLGDTGTSGQWQPDEEAMAGMDVDRPALNDSCSWRIQFSQAGGACLADVVAHFKPV